MQNGENLFYCQTRCPRDKKFKKIWLYHLVLNNEILKNNYKNKNYNVLIKDLRFTLYYNYKVQTFAMNGTTTIRFIYDNICNDTCENIDITFKLTDIYNNLGDVCTQIPKEYKYNVRKICLDYLKINYLNHYNEYLEIYNFGKYLQKLIPDLNNILIEYLFADINKNTTIIVPVDVCYFDKNIYINNKKLVFPLVKNNSKNSKSKNKYFCLIC